jgi:hypothetical protein
VSRAKGFERGGRGVYSCVACGHRTRYTGTQSIGSELCEDCFELAGIFNVHQDGGDLMPYAAEIRQRCARIVERGNVLDSDALTLLEIINAKQSPGVMAAEIKGDADTAAVAMFIRGEADALAKLLPVMCFALETVAHSQGKERELLPLTDQLRAILAGKTVNV